MFIPGVLGAAQLQARELHDPTLYRRNLPGPLPGSKGGSAVHRRQETLHLSA